MVWMKKKLAARDTDEIRGVHLLQLQVQLPRFSLPGTTARQPPRPAATTTDNLEGESLRGRQTALDGPSRPRCPGEAPFPSTGSQRVGRIPPAERLRGRRLLTGRVYANSDAQ